MGHQETPGTALERDTLGFVTDKKGATRGTGGFGILEGDLWDCAKLVEENLGEGV